MSETNAYLTFWYPNGTIFLDEVKMGNTSTGVHNFSVSAPANTGTYGGRLNCTDTAGNKAIGTADFQVPTWTNRIKSLFKQNFRISSLETVSPIYANGEFQVEASFAYLNGTYSLGSATKIWENAYINNVIDSTPLADINSIDIQSEIMKIKPTKEGSLNHSTLPLPQQRLFNRVLLRSWINKEPYEVCYENPDSDKQICEYIIDDSINYEYQEDVFNGQEWNHKTFTTKGFLTTGSFEGRSIGDAVSYNIIAIQDLYNEIDSLKEQLQLIKDNKI